MSSNEFSEEEKQARFARWEKIGVDRIKADLQTGGHREVGGPPAVRDLAWDWVRMEEAKQREIVTLKPGAWGLSVDLKEIGRKIASRFWRKS
jgi:hypothetical protein